MSKIMFIAFSPYRLWYDGTFIFCSIEKKTFMNLFYTIISINSVFQNPTVVVYLHVIRVTGIGRSRRRRRRWIISFHQSIKYFGGRNEEEAEEGKQEKGAGPQRYEQENGEE